MKLFTAYSIFFHLLQGADAQTKPQKPPYQPDVPYWPPAKDPIDDEYTGTKIVGGDPVQPEDRYPYSVALTTITGFQYCGGSLIAPGWVLSAAHCSDYGTNVQIGRYDLNDGSETFEEIPVAREIVHPNFNPNSLDYDFMLMELSRDSTYPVISIDDGSNGLPPGRAVTVMGWGTTSSGGNSSPILLEVEVDIVGNNQCNNDYNGDITASMICAALPGKDACQGDSGGPLIIKRTDSTNDVLVGDVSWGYGCANPNYPGVYGRVSVAYDWITDYVNLGPTASPTSASPTITAAPTGTCKILDISINTDDYGSETSWDIKDQSNTVLYEMPEPDLDNNKEYNWDYCLAPQCSYKFTIYDTFSDGVCCEYGSGSYEVKYNGDIVKSGGSFSESEITEFGCVTSPPAVSPSVSPICTDSLLTMAYTADSSSYLATGDFPCEFISDLASDCLCTDEVVKSHCPVSCGSCIEYGCEDSTASLYPPNGGRAVTCGALRSLSPQQIESYCQASTIRTTCRDTCGNCS